MASVVNRCVLLVSIVTGASFGLDLRIELISPHVDHIFFGEHTSQFYNCLCADDSAECLVHVRGIHHVDVANVYKRTKMPEKVYQPTYVCEIEHHPYISCVRTANSHNQTCAGFSNCRIHQFNFTLIESCDLTCINIAWTDSWYIRYYTSGDIPEPAEGEGECPLAPTTTEASTTTEAPTTIETSTTTKASTTHKATTAAPLPPTSTAAPPVSSPTTESAQQGNSKGDNGASDTVIAVGAGLGSALALTIVIAGVVVALVWRKKKSELKPAETDSKPYDMAATDPEEDGVRKYIAMNATPATDNSPASASEDGHNYEDVTPRPAWATEYANQGTPQDLDIDYTNMADLSGPNLDEDDGTAVYNNI